MRYLNADQENVYFSDGITEDIITQISKISALRLISRTSVMRYKNSDASIKQIATDLNVASILEDDTKLGRTVALKFLSSAAIAGEEAKKRFILLFPKVQNIFHVTSQPS